MQLSPKEFSRLSILAKITMPYDYINVEGVQYAAYRELAYVNKTEVKVKCQFLVHLQPGTVTIKTGSVFEVGGHKMTCLYVETRAFDKNKRENQPKLPHQDDYPYDNLVIISVYLKSTCKDYSTEKLATILEERKTILSKGRAIHFLNTDMTKFEMSWIPRGHKRVVCEIHLSKDQRKIVLGNLHIRGSIFNTGIKSETPLRLFVGDSVSIDGMPCEIDSVEPCAPSDVLTGRIQFTCVARTRYSTKQRLQAWWEARRAEWKDK